MWSLIFLLISHKLSGLIAPLKHPLLRHIAEAQPMNQQNIRAYQSQQQAIQHAQNTSCAHLVNKLCNENSYVDRSARGVEGQVHLEEELPVVGLIVVLVPHEEVAGCVE